LTSDTINDLAERLGYLLLNGTLLVATAESCTGGGLSEIITRIPGSSQWFDRGFVTYSNNAKISMLGVPAEVIRTFGAVSEETAQAMARGALTNSEAQLAVAITGIAGPGGGSEDKPVGTVCFAWASDAGMLRSTRAQLSGDREDVRHQACLMALQGMVEMLEREDQ
jgi:nicotinamide-nucleotide amidase